MRIKQRPEDFSVKESYRFDTVPQGPYRVYLMDKQKLSTFDAIARIRERFGLRPGAISYCGLKDKQGRTEQLIAVDNADVDLQDPDLRLKYLGRTDRPLTAANTTSNRFSVTVRALEERDLPQLNLATSEVNRLGVVNYFDSQRFGSLKHGQGFIAKDLIRGDFEAALRNYFAKPSTLDRSEDSKVKAFWRDNWGDWGKKAPFAANKKYFRILNSLRDAPKDFVRAFLQIDSDYRALLLFTYQSYLWNEGVRRLLQLTFPREHLFPLKYQAGTLLFHRDAEAKTLDRLRGLSFPLLAPDSTFGDGKVEEAVKWVLAREKISLEALKIEEAPKLLYFKHEERPVLVSPHKLVIGRPGRDELNRGKVKTNVAFTLPPGSYATLVVKRLFHFSSQQDDEVADRARIEAERAQAAQAAEDSASAPAQTERTLGGLKHDKAAAQSRATLRAPAAQPRAAAPRRADETPAAQSRGAAPRGTEKTVAQSRGAAPRTPAKAPVAQSPAAAPEKAAAAQPRGFLAAQRQRKQARAEARAQQPSPQRGKKRATKR